MLDIGNFIYKVSTKFFDIASIIAFLEVMNIIFLPI